MNQKIVYVMNEDGPFLASATLKVIAADSEVIETNSAGAAQVFNSAGSELSAVVCNTTDVAVFEAARAHPSHPETVLITDLPIKEHASRLGFNEHILLDHVIAHRSNTDFTIHELRVTLQKILRSDILGISKYLAPGTEVKKATITCTKERDVLNTEVMNYAEKLNLGNYTARLLFGITEELLMNALYDAPNAAGITEYATLLRSEAFSLRPHEYSELSYGCDGDLFAVSVKDPFGKLAKETLLQYIKKIHRRHEGAGLIDVKKGGAGLGFFKILYSSHALICNVEKDKFSEIMAVIDLREYLRDFDITPRSIHYFGSSTFR
jgi:hypothetical protein